MAPLRSLRVFASPCVSLLSLGCGCLGVYEGWNLRARRKQLEVALRDSSTVARFAAETAEQYAGVRYCLPTAERGLAEFHLSLLSPGLLASLEAAVAAAGSDLCAEENLDKPQIAAALAATEVLSRQLKPRRRDAASPVERKTQGTVPGGDSQTQDTCGVKFGDRRGVGESQGKGTEKYPSACRLSQDHLNHPGICLGRITSVRCVSKPLKLSWAEGVRAPGRFLEVVYQFFVPVSDECETSIQEKLKQVLELEKAVQAANGDTPHAGEETECGAIVLGRRAEPRILDARLQEVIRGAWESGLLSLKSDGQSTKAKSFSLLSWILSLGRRERKSQTPERPQHLSCLSLAASPASAPRVAVMEGRLEMRFPRQTKRSDQLAAQITRLVDSGETAAVQSDEAVAGADPEKRQGSEPVSLTLTPPSATHPSRGQLEKHAPDASMSRVACSGAAAEEQPGGEAGVGFAGKAFEAEAREERRGSLRRACGEGDARGDRPEVSEGEETTREATAEEKASPLLSARPGWKALEPGQLITIAYDPENPENHTPWIAVRFGEATKNTRDATQGKLIVFDAERQGLERARAVAAAGAGLLLLGGLKLYVSVVLRRRLRLIPGI
ncbi:putative transmembrane protein [Toxoplasma gondii TgCatPRC2]|uniref:Transmembrane protein n=3 Tax=Toxoplasma gondii TaxID=5811 RepID=A0A125YFL5_TOXGM|nr:hypothetical protein TGME49_239610 [Toxoplasma gondii ME49]EPT30773.1 hypothetical protein TGME49_239610 [Toxoplasma gondii ME49]ESS31364.1 putative transmembrane protein [Toxoplasma gondii VEG]KYK66194.1 putative transmembrane protein [Toxoplasma gondii TgCatPRC2]CEL73326.1 TPA: hypothetical protein BN1205_091980 [Toxoplasma gondii VEG]|eukprot:XP_002366600.1 hypothetical protein TGME49_239610 [Toxoplasma gondii ME49]